MAIFTVWSFCAGREWSTRAGVHAAGGILASVMLLTAPVHAQSDTGIYDCLDRNLVAAESVAARDWREAQSAGLDREMAIAAGQLALEVANSGRFQAADCLLDESALAATRARDSETLTRSRFNQALLASRVTQSSDVSGSWFQATRSGAPADYLLFSGVEDALESVQPGWQPRSPEEIVDLALEVARLADGAGLASLGVDARVLAASEAGGVLTAGEVLTLLEEAVLAASAARDQGPRLRIAEAAIEWVSDESSQEFTQLAYIELASILAAPSSERIEVLATGLLGRLYGLNNRFEEALALTGDAAIGSARLQDTEAELEFLIQLGAISEASGNNHDALDYYSQATRLVDLVRPTLVERRIEAGEPTLRDIMAPALLARVDLMLRLDGDNPATLREVRETLELMKLLDLETLFAELCVRLGAGEIVALETLDHNVAVLYPVMLRDRTEIILATRAGIARHTSSISGTLIDEVAVDFRIALQNVGSDRHLEHGQTLYDALLAPVLDDLERANIETIVFAPDGNLRSAPLSAINNDGRYLVQDFEVATALGLSLVDPQAFKSDGVRAVIAGVSEARTGLAPLPAVVSEVESVATALPDSTVLLDADFTSDSLEVALAGGQVNLVHIATHAQFSPVAEESYLLAHDRRMGLREIEGLIDRAQGGRARPLDLLTLSACETAVGDDRAVLGLAGTAYLAGARSVVGSLWQIPDQSTSVLIESFYTSLIADGQSKAASLRAAQLASLADPMTAHPYHWSAFIVLGNWL